MSRYSIGKICEILDTKPHILRYWEQEIPLLSPRKSRSGRRIYSEADLHLLFRIRYLVQAKGYTLTGAGKRLVEDTILDSRNGSVAIREIRRELLGVAAAAARLRSRLSPVADNRNRTVKPDAGTDDDIVR